MLACVVPRGWFSFLLMTTKALRRVFRDLNLLHRELGGLCARSSLQYIIRNGTGWAALFDSADARFGQKIPTIREMGLDWASDVAQLSVDIDFPTSA